MTGDLRISRIGLPASQQLASAGSAFVNGLSSHGIYIRVSNHQVLFLSFEKHPGPLTLNLQGDPAPLRLSEPGERVEFTAGQIAFPKQGISMPFTTAEIWLPAVLPGHALPGEQRGNALYSIAELIRKNGPHTRITELLPIALGDTHLNDLEHHQYQAHLISLLRACESRDGLQACQALSAFLGLGSGLTPSGDDLVIGFLLCLNRWSGYYGSHWETDSLNYGIRKRASELTNTISLNLIECACAGLADERLLSALDGIFTGNIEPAQCYTLLAGWGNTSGCDALVGLAVASQTGLE